MHPAIKRIVHDIHVIRLHRVAKTTDDNVKSGWDRAEMRGEREPLSDKLAIRICKGRGEIHIVAQHAGIRGATDRKRHFVRDREY